MHGGRAVLLRRGGAGCVPRVAHRDKRGQRARRRDQPRDPEGQNIAPHRHRRAGDRNRQREAAGQPRQRPPHDRRPVFGGRIGRGKHQRRRIGAALRQPHQRHGDKRGLEIPRDGGKDNRRDRAQHRAPAKHRARADPVAEQRGQE